LGDQEHTTLVSIKDTWQTDQVNGHSKLGIGLDVERLLSRKLEGIRS
jgi:hypothetical protein